MQKSIAACRAATGRYPATDGLASRPARPYRGRVSRAALVVVGVLCCAAAGGAWWFLSSGRPFPERLPVLSDAQTPPAVKRAALPWARWTVTEQLVAGSVLVLQVETTTSATRCRSPASWSSRWKRATPR